MEVRPHRAINRKTTKEIQVGNVKVGGKAPISVQSMTNTLTTDIKGTINQIHSLEDAGADIVRVSCPDEKSTRALKEKSEIKYKEIIHNDKVAKVSIVGAGMVSTPGVTYKMFRGLSDMGINILAISTSEIKLSVIIDEDNTLNAVKKLHTIFDLD